MLDEELLLSKTFHMICTPHRCITLCKEILAARKSMSGIGTPQDSLLRDPAFIWEPMEDSCYPQELDAFIEALTWVDVFSPNQQELLSLCDMKPAHPHFDPSTVLLACNKLLDSDRGKTLKAVVARCGPSGCLVAEKEFHLVIPAYHVSNSKSQDPVVDATGGGNTFLGGFCAALAIELRLAGMNNLASAALWGNIAASYAIEQVGIPNLKVESDGIEMWNGTKPQDRVQELITRTQINMSFESYPT